MDSAAHAPFKFARDTYAVRVDNIAACVGRHELIELFSNLIGASTTSLIACTIPLRIPTAGHVRKCDENITDEHGRYMDISFFSRDASRCVHSHLDFICASPALSTRKALCMSGYTVAGVPL